MRAEGAVARLPDALAAADAAQQSRVQPPGKSRRLLRRWSALLPDSLPWSGRKTCQACSLLLHPCSDAWQLGSSADFTLWLGGGMLPHSSRITHVAWFPAFCLKPDLSVTLSQPDPDHKRLLRLRSVTCQANAKRRHCLPASRCCIWRSSPTPAQSPEYSCRS